MTIENAGSVSAASAAARLSEPSWVRDGSAKVQQQYALGLEFEQMLLEQLTSSLTANGEPLGEGAEGSEGDGSGAGAGTSSVLSSMIPTALAESVVAGGGLGLAAELTRQMQSGAGAQTGIPASAAPESAGAPAGAEGGVEADVTGGTRS
jgi:Rod binding domain-containing protein